MELTRIHIKNFRSVKDITIKFEHNCLILLGKNEAGKSNILKAVASVFGEYQISNKDKRKKIDNEKITEFYVHAIFRLSEDDYRDVEKRFDKKFKGKEFIKFGNGKSFVEFLRAFFHETVLVIKFEQNEKPYFTTWQYKKDAYNLLNPLFLVDNQISTSKESEVVFDIEKEISLIVKEMYYEKPQRCIYWQYNDGFLLPTSVNREEFIENPSNVKGLENIFLLCNRENIKKEFEDALSQDGDYSNLLEQVSKSVTTTFQKIWKDFKDTSIQLISDGEDILIKVVNKTKYSFEDRSDGFKKYISILLMLSTQARTNKISDKDLILIDEPDQSLYPTSAIYLKDELLNISKNAKIIYSTHSQYMIDSNCINRHLVIEKNDDITSIKREDINSPFSHDELLRRAIGISIFECIQPINLVFEGWLDKELFIKYIEFKKLKKKFDNYGIVYLKGIVGAETLVQILVLAKKKFVIIADSDQTSTNKKVDFEKNYPEYSSSWLGYADVKPTISTMEDFFEIEYLKKQLLNFGLINYDTTKTAIQNISIAANNDKDLMQKIKSSLVENLTLKGIKKEYDEYVKKVEELINTFLE